MHLRWKGNICKTSECHTILLLFPNPEFNCKVKLFQTNKHFKTNFDWWFLCQSDLF